MSTTAETIVSRSAATLVTQSTLFTNSGRNTSKMAFAAGIVAETMNIQQSMRSAQPAKNPVVFPKI